MLLFHLIYFEKLIEVPKVETSYFFSGRVQEELTEIVYIPKLMKKNDDWYILLDVVPQTMEIWHHLSGIYKILFCFNYTAL